MKNLHIPNNPKITPKTDILVILENVLLSYLTLGTKINQNKKKKINSTC